MVANELKGKFVRRTAGAIRKNGYIDTSWLNFMVKIIAANHSHICVEFMEGVDKGDFYVLPCSFDDDNWELWKDKLPLIEPEPKTDIEVAATDTYKMFDALIDAGFTGENALKILIAGMNGGK